MCKYEGKPTSGLEFYELLCEDENFCKEFGRAILAAGRLESALKLHIHSHAPDENTTKATLGRLIAFAKKNHLLSRMLPALETLRIQRNYLTHNIHALFAGLIEETIFGKHRIAGFRCSYIH